MNTAKVHPGLALLVFAGICNAEISFNRDIRPIMSDTCFRCHGPDRNTRMAGLRLDSREEALKSRRSGVPIIPGEPEKSLIIQRIFSTDAGKIMPPVAAHKELTAKQKDTLRQWVAEGARYEEHWSYQQVQRPAVPKISAASHPIDAFVQSRLAAEGLKPSPVADKRTLIRRLSFDLTGIAPTAEETRAFVADRSPRAYEALVDRLLASPRFAERQTQFWLDAVRFADTSGFHGDNTFPVWPYRDYVLRSFLANKPFDVFTREQLGGDLLPDAGPEQRLATAFNRLHRSSAEGGIQPKEYLAKYASDRVRTTSAVWLGLTVGCAECHDHKFDPITARDFYAFKAFFADIDEEGFVPVKGPKAWGRLITLPTDEQRLEQDRLEERLKDLDAAKKTRLDQQADHIDTWISGLMQRWTAGEFAWRRQRPVHATATNGAVLSVADDSGPSVVQSQNGTAVDVERGEGLIIAGGANPDRSTYSIALRPGAGTWTAIGLEIVSDDALPGLGFARGADRFIVTGFNAEADGRKLDFGLATHNLINYHAGLPPLALIDGDPSTGWGLPMYQDARSPFVALRFAEPLHTNADTTLKVGIAQESGFRRATIGKFRLALSTAKHSWPMTSFKASKENPAQPHLKGLPSAAIDALGKPRENRTADEQTLLRDLYTFMHPEWEAEEIERMKLTGLRSILDAAIPKAVTTAATTPRETRVLPRGNWMDDSGDVVLPAIPAKFGTLANEGRATRLDLANWLVSPQNPLTSRVIANRIWRQLFGAGLSNRLDDLGSQGDPPSHPELLDWLAMELMQPSWRAEGTHAWDYRHLFRTIVMTDTYRQSSAVSKQLESRDPANRLLARQSRFRLDAEAVRDSALSVAGLLHQEFGGPSVYPYQPDGYLAALNYPKREHAASLGSDLYRRSIYVHWQRTFLHPSLLAFDAPSREECTVNRNSSNTPLQALVLLNDPIFVEAARVLAQRAVKARQTTIQRIDWAFEQALGRLPNQGERRILLNLHAESRRAYRAAPKGARQVLSIGEAPASSTQRPEVVAAMLSVTRAILNLHETITRN